jgi:ACS family hexuronate transporter-like MFS transporter
MTGTAATTTQSSVPAARLVSAAGPGTSPAYMWVVLFASLLVQTTASFGNQAIAPLAPFLLVDLGLSKSHLGLVVTAFFSGAVLLMAAAGWASDRFGVRSMFLVGLLWCGAPLLLAAQAPGLAVLMGAMLLSGIGNGISLPPTTRAIIYWFPPRRRGLAMGIKQTGVALAGAIMALAVPRMSEPLGWRGAMGLIGWLTLTAGVLAWFLYREHPDAQAGQARNRVEGAGFKSLLRNRNLILLCATTVLLAAVQLSLIGFMVLFLSERLAYDVALASGLLAVAQTGGVIGRIGWGVVSDLVFDGSRKGVMMIITAGSAASAFGLSFVKPGVPEVVLWGLLIMTGLSAVGWNGINMTFVAELAGRRASATAAGLNLTGSYLGILFGPPLFGLAVDVSGSYVPAFVAASCLGLVAFLLVSQIRVHASA